MRPMKKLFAFKELRRSGTSSLLVLVLLLSLLPIAAPATAGEKLTVMVSILPQVWFVEQIGGPEVVVEALVGPGHSPATFEPTARQVARLKGSAVYFSSGVPFERGLLPRIANSDDSPPIHGPRPHGSGHHGHHHHGDDELDPHFWLDPVQAMAMADTIGNVLAKLDPERADVFHRRTNNLKTRLQNLNNEVKIILEPVQDQTFYVFHPAYGHFAKAFGLHQIAVEDDGHEPGPRQLAKVIDKINEGQAQAIIVQPQFSKKSSQAIAQATDVEILVLDPLAHNYDENLLFIARSLAATLSRETK